DAYHAFTIESGHERIRRASRRTGALRADVWPATRPSGCSLGFGDQRTRARRTAHRLLPLELRTGSPEERRRADRRRTRQSEGADPERNGRHQKRRRTTFLTSAFAVSPRLTPSHIDSFLAVSHETALTRKVCKSCSSFAYTSPNESVRVASP